MRFFFLVAFALGLFAGAKTEAFTLISNQGKLARWPTGTVQYYFHSSVSAGNQTPIRSAFTTWSNVPGLNLIIQEMGTFSSSPSSSDRKNVVNWITSQWTSLSFRPPNNALAVTLLSFDAGSGDITDADIYFNAQNYNWGIVGGAGTGSLIDVQNIATHEVGHLLGIDHSSEEFFESDAALADATMYYASGAGETERRDLADDDTKAIAALYSNSSASTPTISAVNQLDTSNEGVRFQILGSGFGDQTSFVLTRSSNSISDRVARYRTIVSSTEANITLDLDKFGNGGADLIAFNSPSAMSTFALNVDSNSISATSRGGGGGCSIQPNADGEFSWVTFYFVLLSSVSLLLARRRYQRRHEAHAKTEF